MKRLTIGIDLDDTLNCLSNRWIDVYNKEYSDNLPLTDIKSWDIANYVKPECGKDIFKFLHIPGFFRNLDIKPHAIEVVRWLCEHYDVYIVSAAHYAVTGDKGAWLEEFFPFINYQNVIFCTNKSLMKLDYLIDDGSHNLETFTGQGLLFDSHHNQTENRFPRMKNWLEIKEYFEEELRW